MSEREWRFYIQDMLRFAENVQAYSNGLDQEQFEADSLKYDAILRNLELIGEAARHVPDQVRRDHQGIPWRQLVATRNRLIHGYLGIDNDTLWSIVADDIPTLVEDVRALLGGI